MRAFALLPIILSAAVPAASWKMTPYSDADCKGNEINAGHGDGTSRLHHSESAVSYKFEDTGDWDFWYYSDTDCKDHENNWETPGGCYSAHYLTEGLRWKGGDKIKCWKVKSKSRF